MSDLVRVRENGVEHNEGRARAIAKGLEILDEPTHVGGLARRATRVGGRPIKPKTTVAKKAASRKRKKKTSPPPTPAAVEEEAVIEPAQDEEETR